MKLAPIRISAIASAMFVALVASAIWAPLSAPLSAQLPGKGALASDPALATEDSETGEVAFSVAGQGFAMALPEGYCTPTEGQRAFAQEIAAGDSANFTLAQFDVCGTFAEQYVHIKTPRALPAFPLSRPDFLVAMARELDTGTSLAQGMQQAGEDLGNMSGRSMTLAGTDFGYQGYDSDCVYLSGFVRIAVDGQIVKTSAATCITLIASRMFSVNAYDFTENHASFAELRKRARQMAVSIRAR